MHYSIGLIAAIFAVAGGLYYWRKCRLDAQHEADFKHIKTALSDPNGTDQGLVFFKERSKICTLFGYESVDAFREDVSRAIWKKIIWVDAQFRCDFKTVDVRSIQCLRWNAVERIGMLVEQIHQIGAKLPPEQEVELKRIVRSIDPDLVDPKLVNPDLVP